MLTVYEIYIPYQLFFTGALVIDPLSIYIKILIILSLIVISFTMFHSTAHPEEYVLIPLLGLGCMLAVSSVNLISLFVSLEAINISAYLLFQNERKLALKYFIYSITFSGIMLFGISLLYGLGGSMDYYTISAYLSENPFNSLTLIISVLLITAGLGFKLLLFPFNFIFPVLSEKLTAGNISLLAAPTVIAGIAITCRFFLTVLYDPNSYLIDEDSYKLIPGVNWSFLLSLISAISILSASFVLLLQTNIKRCIAFLIFIQCANLLAGTVSQSQTGTSAMLFYLLVYTVNTTGILIWTYLVTEKIKLSTLNDLKSLRYKSPFLSLVFLLFILSIIGIPLTAGFTGKMFILSSLISKGYSWLVFVSVISSLLPFYFFFRIFYSVFSTPAQAVEKIKTEPGYKLILLLLLIPAIFGGFYFTPLFDFAKYGSIIFGIL